MAKITADKVQDLIDLEETTNGGVKNNKLANFSYTEVAYSNNEAAGVDSYDPSQENNIPNSTPVATETNQTVLDRGFRSQGASLSRMLTNHFFGRASYNLNKIHDWFTDYLKVFKTFLSSGIWNLEKNVADEISDFDGVVDPGTYKGKDFTGISSDSLPEWFMQSEHQLADFGYWTLIVENGIDFKRQVLHYTRKSNGVFELGQYTAIRTMTLQPSGEIDNYGTWTSKSVEADHALAADNATNASQLGGTEAANYTLKSELTSGTVKPQISKTLEDVDDPGANWGIDYKSNSGTVPRDWWCAFDDNAKNIVPVKAPMPYFGDSIFLDFTLDGTALTNVEFQNVGNGIFQSKNVLKGISMDNLLAGGSDVGNGTIGKAAASSIEAALKAQFGSSIRLKTYCRTYDGAAHAEKVFVPLESEVQGSGNMKNSADKKDIYPRWQIPNKNIKTGVNGWWWCANKSSTSGRFCYVLRDGYPGDNSPSSDRTGVALAFKLY